MPTEASRILVVDDEPRAVELLVRILRARGKVETALSGAEAAEKLAAQDFEVVICDQRMPGMTGVDLLSSIADRDDTVGRILLTGYSDLDATVEAINRGRVHAFLHKPCSPQDLRATIAGVLDRVHLARENARLLARLDTAKDQVVAAERMAAIGKMSAMVVHDLRSPITVVQSVAAELERVGESRGLPELAPLGQEIRTEADHMQRMCDELMDVTRANEATPRSEKAMDDVVSSALAPLAEAAGSQGVTLELELHSDAIVCVDEDGLRRALRNLAQNALEAMADGGTLRVETRADGPWVWIRVRDNGPGIPAEILDDVFEPFVTQGKAHGSGLGLAVVRKVVQDHEGGVEVSKPEGGGTAFDVRLPVAS